MALAQGMALAGLGECKNKQIFCEKTNPTQETHNCFEYNFDGCDFHASEWSVASPSAAENNFVEAAMKQLVGTDDWGYFIYAKESGNTIVRYNT